MKVRQREGLKDSAVRVRLRAPQYRAYQVDQSWFRDGGPLPLIPEFKNLAIDPSDECVDIDGLGPESVRGWVGDWILVSDDNKIVDVVDAHAFDFLLERLDG